MRVNKYAAELDNGNTVTISSASSERVAKQIAEEAIQRETNYSKKYDGATAVVSVRLIERGRWG